MIRISKRLETICEYISKGHRLADIGTDHALVPVKLILDKKIEYAIAMDIGRGPLEKARVNVERYNLSDRISLRLSNGFEKLEKGEADTVLIAGLGGDLMIEILEHDKGLRHTVREYILSPHSEWKEVRRYLREKSFRIVDEDMVYEDGKYYVIWKVIYAGSLSALSSKQVLYDMFGKILIDKKHAVLVSYLQKEEEKTVSILEGLRASAGVHSEKRRWELQEYLVLVRECLDEIRGNIGTDI